MARTDKMWQQVDEAFEHMDDAFACLDEACKECRSHTVINGMNAQPLETGYHVIRFSSTTLAERWRLCRRFLGMALHVLFKGQAKFRFKNRSEHSSYEQRQRNER